MRQDHLCGLSFWHPQWLQKYANTKWFMAVYGLLGTVQAMSYMYFVVTLTTIEKRFKIPSQTTGIILSGNEISQILLSLILSYTGGQRNRPRWIAWGMIFCAISCFILALPHIIYGPGDDAIHLTKEFIENNEIENQSNSLVNLTSKFQLRGANRLCFGEDSHDRQCEEIITILPLVLIFLSQFVLGVGNTLYYSLGQTYLDDNTKKTKTPIMLAYAMSLRMIGPIFGFFLGHVSLNMFIDTKRTPLIDKNDPRWLGAWWFGWIILGSIMLLFSGLIGLFPKELPKTKPRTFHSEMPKALRSGDNYNDESFTLNHQFSSNPALQQQNMTSSILELPKLADFPKALLALLKNKLLMFNIIAAIFYILGSSGFITFLAKYMEVQFLRSAQNATIIIGPLTLIGMVLGLLLSGCIISKKRPEPSKLLFWNVILGFIFLLGLFSFMFLHCGDTGRILKNGNLSLTTACNEVCSCNNVRYSPVCDEKTTTTFFSPCHAGCESWNSETKTYSQCQCLNNDFNQSIYNLDQELDFILNSNNSIESDLTLTPGACLDGCKLPFIIFCAQSFIVNLLASSGRIGNILVNYRAVTKEEKSFAQGLALMMISLFALIPGPIIFGRIIDNTCISWNMECGKQGNCQFYNQDKFRYYVNSASLCLTTFGVIFDFLVWYYGRHLDLYGEKEEQRREQMKRKNRVTSPLL